MNSSPLPDPALSPLQGTEPSAPPAGTQQSSSAAQTRPSSGTGLFVTLEGIDKSGKTTQTELLRVALQRRGLRLGYAGHQGETLREPGGTPLGEEVRELLLHRRHDIGAPAEALLYAAARAQLVADVVRPSLAEGWVVVLDRYIDSSLAYQGFGRGLGLEAVVDLNTVAIGAGGEGPLWPDVTLVLDLDPLAAAQRAGGAPDRIEREGLELQRRVAAGYREIARRYPQRVYLLDATRTAGEIAEEAERLVVARLQERVGV
jgi:dTMP kinase